MSGLGQGIPATPYVIILLELIAALIGSTESDISHYVARDFRRKVLKIELLSNFAGSSFNMVGFLLLLSYFPFIRCHYLFAHGILSTS